MLSHEAGRVSKARSVLQTIYAVYDDLGHVKEMRTEKSDGSIIARSTYAHDKNGNITDEWKEDGSHVSYVYGSLNELQQVTYVPAVGETKTVSYQYDLFGNRETEKITVGDPETGTTTNTYTYDPVSNRLVTINGQAVQTDEVGNVTQDDRHGYHYNGLGQLTSVTSGAQTARFEYSLDGLRTKKIAIDGSTEYYYYNGGELAYVTNQDDNIKYSFVRSGSGALLYFIDYRTNSLGDVYTYLRNAHGDIIGLVDAAGEVGRYEYDAWGNVTGTYYAGTDEAKESKVLEVLNANPFRYAGYYYDTDTGLYYLKARYYDPTTGRFLSKDPMAPAWVDPAGQNSYMYARNNPIELVDPDGRSPVIVSMAIGGSVGALVGGGFQVYRNLRSGNKWYSGIGLAMLAGGVSGAISTVPIPGLATMLGRVGAGYLSSTIMGGVGNTAANLIKGDISNFKDVLASFGFGAAAGYVGNAAGRSLIRVADRYWGQLSRMAQKRIITGLGEVSQAKVNIVLRQIKNGISDNIYRQLVMQYGADVVLSATVSAIGTEVRGK